ncbi:hypothetical protein TRFO_15769 [Tritrichomonas foetus]|uniref:Ubiquitin-like domain-containing protein n=1 Tax=Tritrichomonas foetus TaxID=1144522 RepID=A0A1J4KWB1_9EUKA|nr:hypothetical protein TRFO_15769 [Tritrichomonas foetus]|eukprot:OHT13990.1 hypothetical protein TRFO_15769 [Tritrichomonas foetus]
MDSVFQVTVIGLTVTTFSVHPTDTIDDIIKVSPSLAGCRFIHNGQILGNALSFSFYNISDGARIYTSPLPKNASSSTLKKERMHHRASTNSFDQPNQKNKKDRVMEVLSNRLQMAMAKQDHRNYKISQENKYRIPIMVTETSKLADMMRIKIENSPAAYRKILSNHQLFCESDKPKIANSMPTIVPPSPSEPSIDILPVPQQMIEY